MDVVHARAAGIDISKRDAKVCVRIPGKRRGQFTSTVTTWGSTTNEILGLVEFLVKAHVTVVVMEATSDYWKPFYFLMEESLPVMLVNAKHAKNMPGRKTDVSDATWLAQLVAHGLLRASFVPPKPIRELRDLTRARVTLVGDRTRDVQRLEKMLESSGIKLSSVVANITGVSSRLMLTALIQGVRDPAVLAEFAQRRMRSKIPELVEALTGRFTEHHAYLAQLHLDQIDARTLAIESLTARIDLAMKPYESVRDALVTVPGVSTLVADVLIAETGADMAVFPDAGHLASWAGVCPGSNESAGRVKSSKTMAGNKYLKAALGIAALAASHSKTSYLAVRYRRISSRRGPAKAIVALEHTILNSVWKMLTTGEVFEDLGADYFTRLSPERVKARAMQQLQQLGYDVTVVERSGAIMVRS
ncbi:IS110 family transposase [Cryobacterium frigoriphilum]|uniref:IS110 family transposase n=1 Tax=Cryobacterium frigoriphilum TaxID=1259150 RepID=A0A4R8ZTA5_9MICO|nr:IS110 family transposase [Cryobacterium frigoriphilum]TFD44803.1 IS110 family transposase [Cryobacterium frigoriphilum]